MIQESQPLLHEDRPKWSLKIKEKQPLQKLIIPCIAEFIATALLVLVGCGSSVSESERTNKDFGVEIAFATIIVLLILCFENISGAHLNPVVSFSFWIIGKSSLVQTLLYSASQVIGASAGAGLMKIVIPNSTNDWGQTTLSPNVTEIRGFVVETICTCILVMTVLLVTSHPTKNEGIKQKTSFAVFGALMACQLLAAPLTGCSMNPARSFGPALIANVWSSHWVYWVGPFCGSIISSLLFLLFSHYQ